MKPSTAAALLLSLVPLACTDEAALEGVAADTAVQVISGSAECADCTIERFLVARIDDAAFPGAAGFPEHIAVSSDGRVLISPGILPNPHVADPSGRVIAAIGREGEGPNEYRRMKGMLEYAGGFLAFDAGLGRVVRLSRDLEYVGVERIPAMSLLAPLVTFDDGSWLANGTVAAPDHTSRALHLVGPDGTLRRSFGDVLAPTDLPHRLATRSADGTFLVARVQEYRIERWDTAGRLLSVHERHAAWYPDNATERGADAQRDATPDAPARVLNMTGLHEDDDGLLWVQLTEYFPDPGPEVRLPPGRTIVEVLDLESGTVIASATTNTTGAYVSGGPYNWHYEESERGEPILTVWGFRLSRLPAPAPVSGAAP